MSSAAPRSFRQNRPPARTLSYTENDPSKPKGPNSSPILIVMPQRFSSQAKKDSVVISGVLWEDNGNTRNLRVFLQPILSAINLSNHVTIKSFTEKAIENDDKVMFPWERWEEQGWAYQFMMTNHRYTVHVVDFSAFNAIVSQWLEEESGGMASSSFSEPIYKDYRAKQREGVLVWQSSDRVNNQSLVLQKDKENSNEQLLQTWAARTQY